jgi:undecaprenyl-diphosphatase
MAELVRANGARYFALFRRKPWFSAMPMWCLPRRVTVGAIVVVAVTAETMIAVDAWAVTLVRRMPEWLITTFDHLTDLGKSVWLLVPIAVALGAMRFRLANASAHVAALCLRDRGGSALFVAVGLPGLASRSRSGWSVAPAARRGSADPFSYRPLGWSVEYASLPSGHAIDAFAIAMAVGALWPRARPLLWTYAVLIAMSRVVLTAHFPSDVIAGAVIGVVGVLLVRDWFAARGLAFVIGADGIVRPLPGPSSARIKRVAWRAAMSGRS